MIGHGLPAIENVVVERQPMLDGPLLGATRFFLQQLPPDIPFVRALVFGSFARGENETESDVDLAVILSGEPGNRWSATRAMARLAFDVLMKTDVLIDPLAIWEVELEHPDRFSSPALIRAILRDGVAL